MAASLTNLLYHIVFSTRDRQPLITAEIRSRLEGYLGGIIREEHGIPFDIACPGNHAHLAVKLAPDCRMIDFVRTIKSNSSRWINQDNSFPDKFHWQSGYGAFSVSESNLGEVRRYIQSQDEHHRKFSFQDEFRLLLKKHNVSFDEQYLWG